MIKREKLEKREGILGIRGTTSPHCIHKKTSIETTFSNSYIFNPNPISKVVY